MPDTPTLLERLREQRTAAVTEWETLISTRETARATFEARTDATDEDRTAFAAAEETFRAASESDEAEVLALDERIRVQSNLAERRAEAGAAAVTGDRVVSEPHTYRRDNGDKVSYFRDLAVVQIPEAAASIRSSSPEEARERLTRHGKEMDLEFPKRAAAREARAASQVDEAESEFRASLGVRSRGLDASPFERRVSPNRTDGAGGYFVPPAWLIDEYIRYLRAGRVAAGLCRQMDLPEGTDSINIPALTTSTITAVQTADNAPVASQDIADSAVTANVKTIAGQEDVALQLVEMSPGQIIDQVIMEDLAADYNKRLDLQVLAGNGSNSSALNGGQVLGLYPSTNWSNTNGVTYTDGSPAGWKFLSVFGAMASKIASTRFLTSSLAYVVHPRRWYWYATAADSTNRPLIETNDVPGFNLSALGESEPSEGLAGHLPFGPNVYVDANVTTADTTGGGTGQDVAIGAIWDDLWLFEGEMRTRVLPEVLSGTLQLRFQAYNYLAFLVRYGQSVAIGTGSGFAAPTGAVSSITF